MIEQGQVLTLRASSASFSRPTFELYHGRGNGNRTLETVWIFVSLIFGSTRRKTRKWGNRVVIYYDQQPRLSNTVKICQWRPCSSCRSRYSISIVCGWSRRWAPEACMNTSNIFRRRLISRGLDDVQQQGRSNLRLLWNVGMGRKSTVRDEPPRVIYFLVYHVAESKIAFLFNDRFVVKKPLHSKQESRERLFSKSNNHPEIIYMVR